MRPLPVVPCILLLSVVFLAGCAGGTNLIKDPGFEEGGDDWTWLEGRDDWVGFEVVEDPVAEGERALRTAIDVDLVANHSLVAGAIHKLDAGSMDRQVPERLRGQYRVDEWQTTVDRTYVQVVVGLFPREGAGSPVCPGLAPSNPCQLAYILTGVEDRPLALANRQYVFVGTAEPTLGEWLTFDFELREHFRQAWRAEPTGFDHLWLYLETRYDADDTESGAGNVSATVHWDDLFLGV